MQRRNSNAKPDCEEKRDPDKRSQIIQKKENELDPDTQLETRTLAAACISDSLLKLYKPAFPFYRRRMQGLSLIHI